MVEELKIIDQMIMQLYEMRNEILDKLQFNKEEYDYLETLAEAYEEASKDYKFSSVE